MLLTITPDEYATQKKRLLLKVGQTYGRSNFLTFPGNISGMHFIVKAIKKNHKFVIQHVGKNAGEIVCYKEDGQEEVRVLVKTNDTVEIFANDVYFPVKDFAIQLTMHYNMPVDAYRRFVTSGIVQSSKKLSDIRFNRELIKQHGPVTVSKLAKMKAVRTEKWIGTPDDFMSMLSPEQMRLNGVRKQDILKIIAAQSSCEMVDARERRGEIPVFHMTESGFIDFTQKRKAEIAERERVEKEMLLRADEDEDGKAPEDSKADEGDEVSEDEEDDDEFENDEFIVSDSEDIYKKHDPLVRIDAEKSDEEPSSPILMPFQASPPPSPAHKRMRPAGSPPAESESVDKFDEMSNW